MTIPKHTSLSLGGNVPQYEYSNKQRSKFYDKEDRYGTTTQISKSKNQGQVGYGFWANVISGAAGGLGAIVGAVGGPIGSGALGAAASYGAKNLAEQYGLGMDNKIQVPSYIQTGRGHQYKSPKNVGLWGTPNSFGAVSMNMPISL